jgi:hypothetical protein
VRSYTLRIGAVFGVFALILFPWAIRRLGYTEAEIVGWMMIAAAGVVIFILPAFLIWKVVQLQRGMAYLIGMLGVPPMPKDGKIADVIQLHHGRGA